MLNVIIINGAPQSGKDTLVKYCKEYCDDNECAYVHNYSTVDLLKGMLFRLGWDGDKDNESRKLLADMKRFWVSNNNGSVRETIDKVFSIMGEYDEDDDVIMFIHCREPLEIDKIKSILKSLSAVYPISVFTLIVNREEAEGKAFSNEADKHTAEYKYDITIDNNDSLITLRCCAEQLCEQLIKEEY